MTEREKPFDIGNESNDRDTYEAIFEHICTQASERFNERGAHEPLLFVLTRLGIALVPVEMEVGADREFIAREIGDEIRRTAINVDDEPVYDEPLAFILASEAWVVEYDKEERTEVSQLPPRLDPRRKEILQVTLRTRELSFSRNWPIIRKRRRVTLGESHDLSGEGMTSVWDIILTG